MFEQIFQSKISRLETISECLDNQVDKFCQLISARLEVDFSKVVKEFNQTRVIFEMTDDELNSYFKDIKKEKRDKELEQKRLEKEKEKKEKLELKQKLKEEKKMEKQLEKEEQEELKRQERQKLKEEKELQKIKEREEKTREKKKSQHISTIASKKYDWTTKPLDIQLKDNQQFWGSYNLKIEGCQYMCSIKTSLIYQKIGDKYELFGIKELDNECILEESLDDEIKIWAYASNIIVPSISQELINKAHSLNNKFQQIEFDKFYDIEIK